MLHAATIVNKFYLGFSGLAVADLCSLMALIWTNICYAPLIKTADLTFEAEELHYLTSGWPHVAFTRVSSWITAFITFERCICITMPLKVRCIAFKWSCCGYICTAWISFFFFTSYQDNGRKTL